MRGGDKRTGELFSYVDLEKRVRSDHPLRAIRGLVNEALVALEHEFSGLYAPIGRPSISPEKLLRAMLLQALYSIRSERQLMGRLEYDLLFRWFVGIGVDAAVWDHSVFSKNRDRLLEGNIAARFLAAVLDQPRVKKLLSTEHFTVDGTLIEAWASLKSFKPRDGSDEPPASGGRNTEADFHGKKRSNVRPLLAMEMASVLRPPLAGGSSDPSRGLKLFKEDHASISVPSTVKCSVESSSSPAADPEPQPGTLRRYSLRAAGRGSLRTPNGPNGSITPNPTNQRNSRSYSSRPVGPVPTGLNTAPATASLAAASPAISTVAQSVHKAQRIRAPAPAAPRSQAL